MSGLCQNQDVIYHQDDRMIVTSKKERQNEKAVFGNSCVVGA
jgi:hypothetical protein